MPRTWGFRQLLISLFFLIFFQFITVNIYAMEPPTPPFLKGKFFLRHSETTRNKFDLSPTSKSVENTKSNSQMQIPIFTQDSSSLAFSARQSSLGFNPDQANYPDVYEQNFSITYDEKKSEAENWSLNTSLGSSSDKPFQRSSDDNYGLTFSWTQKKSTESKWTWMIVYSSQRAFLKGLPLPGFIYSYEPNPDFKLSAGVPFFSLNQMFNEKWGLNLFILFPQIYRSSINYKILGPFQIAVGLESTEESFLLTTRTNPDERHYFREKKIFINARVPLSHHLASEFEIGSSYDRYFFKSDKYVFYADKPEFIESTSYFKISGMVFF